MARQIHRLSPAKVRAIKSPGLHADGGGLYLQVTVGSNGNVNKSWLFRFARAGRERQMGLGSLHTVGLAEAREEAERCRKLLRERKDPIEQRDVQRVAELAITAKSMTFDQCAAGYLKAHEFSWRNAKHRGQWTSTLQTYVSPVFGKLPVQRVDVGLVMRVLEPLWAEKPETASRVRGRIESILAWATVRGHREGPNPAVWRNNLDTLLPARSKVRAVRHHPALPYAEVAAFMESLRTQNGHAARALEFAILTACRTGEVIGAKWAEIDLKEAVWVIPSSRMKAGREHRVPLSGPAVALVGRMKEVQGSEYVFPSDGDKPLSNMALEMVLRRMHRRDITVHGFRSTFRTWAAERSSFPREVVEAALAHVIGSKVEAAYQRGDLFEKRRQLMSAWERYCVRQKCSAEVVPIRAAIP